MKKVLENILCILLLFIAASCKTTLSESSPSESITYFSVSGIVFDVVSSDYSPALKKGAKIYLDKDSTVSDEEGKYIFNKISAGSHNVVVNLLNYEPYSKTISVTGNTDVAIYLYGIKNNYFPLQENSRKKFKYSSSASNAVYSWEDKGEATWVISSSKQSGNLKVYEVTEKIMFTHKTYAPLNSERIDSASSTFYINESSTNIISFKSSVLDGVSFNRSLDPRLEQGGFITLSFNTPGSLISNLSIALIKNIGLSKIVQFGNGWNKTYELIQ